MTLLHLSDLHFGRIDEIVLSDLRRFLDERAGQIDLTVLTGDLTQRARKGQFAAANEFLNEIPGPTLVIPGNHDVPLDNLFLRFFRPYRRFTRSLAAWLSPNFENDEVAVFGLWSMDRFSVKDGRLRSSQLAAAEEWFAKIPPHKARVVAMHHPPDGLVGQRNMRGVERLWKLKPDLVLFGHDHHARVEMITGDGEHRPLLIASGTSASNRTRSESNSFNLIRLFKGRVEIEVFAHGERGFEFLRRHEHALPK